MVAESHPIHQPAQTKPTVCKVVGSPRAATASSRAAHTMTQPRLYALYVLSRCFMPTSVSEMSGMTSPYASYAAASCSCARAGVHGPSLVLRVQGVVGPERYA